MNIHEIIFSWETETLPKDLDALAAIQNKVDDYNEKAKAALIEASEGIVRDMYRAETACYSLLSEEIQKLIDSIIPDSRPKVVGLFVRPDFSLKGGPDL